ncbi:LOW QUALITY PROTEIN: hypothetical protein MKX08_000824 [Trichoderma sp. CBMAI-0020]|nr:LOW QUALITY PROTEIN: hypothetical protein MKX08_000824 [Trichoderma sp. CBMAI-0020]
MSQQASAAGINTNCLSQHARSSLRPRDPASDSHSHLPTPLEPRDWDLDAIPAPSLGSPLAGVVCRRDRWAALSFKVSIHTVALGCDVPDLINSVHRPVGGRTSTAKTGTTVLFQPVARLGAQTGHQQACMSIRSSVLIISRVEPRPSPTTGTTHMVPHWQRRNPGVPNVGAAATPINHGAADDRQTFLTLHRAPPSAVLRPMKRPQPIWTEHFSRYPSRGPFAPADRAGSTTRRRLHRVSAPDMVLSASDRGVRQRDWRHVLAQVPSTGDAS